MENQKDEIFIDTASSGRFFSMQTFSQEKIIKNYDQACQHQKNNLLIGHVVSRQTCKRNYSHSWANWSKWFAPIRWKLKYLSINVEIVMQGGAKIICKLNKRIAEHNLFQRTRINCFSSWWFRKEYEQSRETAIFSEKIMEGF